MMGGGNKSTSSYSYSDQQNRADSTPGVTTQQPNSGDVTPSSQSGTSWSQRSGEFVSDTDVSELEHSADLHTATLSDFDRDSPSPIDFSRETINSGAQARHIRAGIDGQQAIPMHPSDTKAGTWDAFDSEDIITREPLKNAVDTTGRGEQVMEKITLTDSDGRAAMEAYVTNYDHDWEHPHAPNIHSAHSQLSVSTALDAMGVVAPRHSFDAESKEMFVESVSRPGYDAELATEGELSTEYANRVDGDQFCDVMAANLIAGNVDLKGENMMVGEDGRVIPFDFDWTARMQSPEEFTENYQEWANDALAEINAARDEPLEVTPDDIVEQARDLATELHESGMYTRIHDAVSQVDEYIENLDESEFGGWNDPDMGDHAGRVRVHTLGWSRNDVSQDEISEINTRLARFF